MKHNTTWNKAYRAIWYKLSIMRKSDLFGHLSTTKKLEHVKRQLETTRQEAYYKTTGGKYADACKHNAYVIQESDKAGIMVTLDGTDKRADFVDRVLDRIETASVLETITDLLNNAKKPGLIKYWTGLLKTLDKKPNVRTSRDTVYLSRIYDTIQATIVEHYTIGESRYTDLDKLSLQALYRVFFKPVYTERINKVA